MQHVEVQFKYRTFSDKSWKSLDIAAEAFFQTYDLPPGSRLDIYGISKFLDYRRYLPEPIEAIRNIELRLVDPSECLERTESYTYWNRGSCQLIRRRSNVPGEKSCEYVIQVKVASSRTSVTLKIEPDGDVFTVNEYIVDVNDRLSECLSGEEPG